MTFATLILIATLNGAGTDVASVDDRPYSHTDYNAANYTVENPAPWVPSPTAQYRIVKEGDWSNLPLTSSQPFPKQNGWTIDGTYATRVWVMATRITVAEISGGQVVRTFDAPDNFAMNPTIHRLVIQGTVPSPSTASKMVRQTGWTIDATTATRVWGETDIPASIILSRKREHAREIMEQAMANETEPDFTAAGITNCPIATKQWVSGQVGGTPSWASITSKPTTISGFGIIDAIMSNDARLTDARTPTAHIHAQGDISGLVAALAGKASTTHAHAIADTTGLQAALDGKQAAGSYAASSHTHTWGNITSTPTTLTGYGITDGVATNDARLSDARTPLTHTHTKAQITDFAHTHPQSEITNLVTDLAGKSAVGHTHTKAEIEAVLTGVITSHSHAGGSDPWTYVVINADFSTTSATAVDVTGLAFTPAAGQNYEVDGQLRFRTAATATGPRPGIAWPTGLTDGTATVDVTSAAGTKVMTNGNISAAVLAPVGGLPSTTGSWPGKVDAVFTAGPTPSGTFKIQLASETAGTSVTIKSGSFIRYRTY